MKINLCIIVLVTFLSATAATPDIQKDDSESQINENDNAENTENEHLNSQIEDAQDEGEDSYENDNDTDTSDTDNDVKALFSMVEEDIFKRLSDIEKSFDDAENEQVSVDDDAEINDIKTDTDMTDVIDDGISEKYEIETEDIALDDSAKSIIDSESSTDVEVKNIERSESKIQNSDAKIIDKESSENIGNSKSEKTTNDSIEKNIEDVENSNNLTILESEAEDNDSDIDNYYEELLNSDLEDTDIFTDFIGDDEEAYSVVDITLPKDTQFEMVKYEKVQNGRKMVLMKLVPVGSSAEDEKQSTNKLEIESGKTDAKKELIIPVKDTNTVQGDNSTNEDLNNNNDKGPTRALNKNLISVDLNTVSDGALDNIKGADSTKENSKETVSDSKAVSDDISEDVSIEDSRNELKKKLLADEAKNKSKSAAAKEDNAKWCICYDKLSDIPWVVRLQMGV